ncbi:hypothetical protein BO70DRAFT_405330 [Aspergillus heteromorphus CBS 117.55]|uniref:Uncharacterized protein n=1 Tax=Aspergillus heteromorphus CBS 117.55 TaxID=1448321 RepID=A0A317W7R1_9EURO|nr:uncharacterized protein BO70DRAFT_405330 [Aspergillus heteromorphus CBS 117.55]PWY82119.1 hypothetical protein BO70DRAFT_405330 [Aspergillus heteromorphus CBS 117.55]
MGLLVKLAAAGLGFISEAFHAARSSSSSSSAALPIDSAVDEAPKEMEVTVHASDNASLRSSDTYPVETPESLPKSTPACSDNVEGIPPQPNQLPKNEPTEYPSDTDTGAPINLNQDEAVWQLDEMAERMRSPTSEEPVEAAENELETECEKVAKREALVRELVAMAGPPPEEIQRLPCSVIIPQRRPRKKERGFVRAYAPVLETCGIGQDVFLKFVDYLDQVNRASAWIEVVFLAGEACGYIPEPTAMIVSLVVCIVAGTARELQQRQRENSFLDRVNQEILMPRGLYGMIMAFKDRVPSDQNGLSSSLGKLFSKQHLDINQTVEKYRTPEPSKLKRGLNAIRLESGKTYGEVELPEAAELVYPDIDRAVAQAVEGGEEQGRVSKLDALRQKAQGAGEWVSGYMDNRAHVFYEAEHPGSSLAVPSKGRTPLKSRFNDPNHPANSGSFIALLSGGMIPVPGFDKMVLATQRKIGVKRLVGGKKSQNGWPEQSRPMRMAMKMMQKDVLYLLIVNLPTEEEAKESVTKLEGMMQREAEAEAAAETAPASAPVVEPSVQPAVESAARSEV